MKVTTQMFYNNFLAGIQQNMEAIMNDGEQLSSGKRVNRPSDDPAALTRIVGYKTELSLSAEYNKMIDMAKGPLQTLDSALGSLSNNLQRANELAISGANDTIGSESRSMIAKEVSALIDSSVDIANTKAGDQYIFSGYQSNTAPIDKTTGEFIGDSNSFEVDISLGVKVALNIPANNLFSFKRINANDSKDAILPPSTTWNNGGGITIPDADPISALKTNQPVFSINAGDKITIGGNPAYNLTAGIYTGAGLAAQLNADTAGSGATFSYNTSTNKFIITDSGGGAQAVTSAPARVLTMLGFTSSPANIPAGSSVSSDSAAGRITNPATDIVSLNGGTLSITAGVNDTSPVSVAIGANATLNTIATAINTNASAKVKAYVVNFNTTGVASKDDYRLIIASNQVGQSNNVTVSATTTDPANTGLNNLTYTSGSTSGLVLDSSGKITNYNYITDPTNANYYSFNNNYLNGNNILRALNFLKVSLESNDTGRIQKALDYIGNTMDNVSQYTAEVGAGLNKVNAEEGFQADRQTNVQSYLSNEQDADMARVYSDISQRQVALQSLKLTGVNFMQSSLFDFLK